MPLLDAFRVWWKGWKAERKAKREEEGRQERIDELLRYAEAFILEGHRCTVSDGIFKDGEEIHGFVARLCFKTKQNIRASHGGGMVAIYSDDMTDGVSTVSLDVISMKKERV